MASSLTHISRKLFGSRNDRELKRLRPSVDRINELEPAFAAKSPDELRALVTEWKARFSAIAAKDEREEALWEILPEVFAAVREASKRTLGQRHFDVQLLGGMMLIRAGSPK